MTLTIEVTPEMEARLRQKAARRGETLDDYLLGLANRDEDTQDIPVSSRLAAMRAIGSYNTRANAGLPPLSEQDISRESIYGERGQ